MKVQEIKNFIDKEIKELKEYYNTIPADEQLKLSRIYGRLLELEEIKYFIEK